MLCLPTAERTHVYDSNTYAYFTEGMNASLEKPLDWLEKQDRWARSQVLQFAAPCIFCLLTGSMSLPTLRIATLGDAALRFIWADPGVGGQA